jgi:hypothetical protein
MSRKTNFFLTLEKFGSYSAVDWKESNCKKGMRNEKKEDGKMKRLIVAGFLLLTLSTAAIAHEGSIGMYTDLTGTDCDMTFTPYLSFEVSILYYRSDGGPNGITAAQFRVQLPPSGLTIQTFTQSPEVSISLGNITTGITLAFTNCSGAGQDYLLLGTIEVVAFVDQPYDMWIALDEGIDPRNPPVSVRVTMCDSGRTKHGVLGGWFKSPNGTCSVGIEETTWGAIKGMYTD